MKQTKSLVIFLVLGFLTFSGWSGRIEAAQESRLVIRFSPTLGLNVGLSVWIDGREAGVLTKGHIFDSYLRPGRHLIALRNNGRRFDELETIVRLRPGQTYSYVVKHPPSQLVLEPSGLPR